MNSFQYTNTVAGSNYVNAEPGIDPERIYDVAREGIGLEPGGSATSDKVGITAYAFARKGVNTVPPPVPGQYHIMISLMSGFVSQQAKTEIGGVINESVFYFFDIDGDSVGYLTQFGDTVTDVRDGLISAINGHTWGFSVTASIEAANRIEVLAESLGVPITCGISTTIYKTGFYTEFALNGGPVKQYLIELNESASDYPILFPISPTYDFSSLTLAPAGIQAAADIPSSYTWDAFTPTFEDFVTIVDVPEVVLPGPGQYLYADSKIYVGLPTLVLNERLKMIVI